MILRQFVLRGYTSPVPSINPKLVTTTFELAGYRTVGNLGVVRGIVVRSRSILGTIGAGVQTLKVATSAGQPT